MLYVNPLATPAAARMDSLTSGSAKEKVALNELEHYFLFMLLQEMRKTVRIAGESTRNHERQLFDEMLDDALSGEMARSGQLGIASQMREQLM